MNQSIDAFIRRHQMLENGDLILAAVSGGADSMVLLDWLWTNRKRYGLTLVVMHVHHGLRGADADEDERFVRRYCESRGIAYDCSKLKLDKTERSGSLQDIARNKRYEALGEKMREVGATKLAVAHHGDDQAETVLMQWIRGTETGQGGMPAVRPFAGGKLIRPFLCLSKAEIEVLSSRKTIPYRHDASNDSQNYTRNRLRQTVMPFLYEENPRLHKTVQRQAEQVQLEEAYLAEQAYQHFQKLRVANRAVFCDDLLHIPSALQRKVIHLLLNYLDGNKIWTRHDVDAVFELLNHTEPSACRDLTVYWKAERRYGELHFLREKDYKQQEDQTEIDVELSINQEYKTVRGVLRVQAGAEGDYDDHVSINREKTAAPLRLRTRRPGDRIRLPDGGGTKKIKDIMIDYKIPKSIRDQWPILTDDHGTILWVPLLIRSYDLLKHGLANENAVVLTYKESSDTTNH